MDRDIGSESLIILTAAGLLEYVKTKDDKESFDHCMK